MKVVGCWPQPTEPILWLDCPCGSYVDCRMPSAITIRKFRLEQSVVLLTNPGNDSIPGDTQLGCGRDVGVGKKAWGSAFFWNKNEGLGLLRLTIYWWIWNLRAEIESTEGEKTWGPEVSYGNQPRSLKWRSLEGREGGLALGIVWLASVYSDSHLCRGCWASKV